MGDCSGKLNAAVVEALADATTQRPPLWAWAGRFSRLTSRAEALYGRGGGQLMTLHDLAMSRSVGKQVSDVRSGCLWRRPDSKHGDLMAIGPPGSEPVLSLQSLIPA